MDNIIKCHNMHITKEIKGTADEQKNIQRYNTWRDAKKETGLGQCNCARINCRNKANTVVMEALFDCTIKAEVREPGTVSAGGEACRVGLVPLCNDCANIRVLDVKRTDIVYLG